MAATEIQPCAYLVRWATLEQAIEKSLINEDDPGVQGVIISVLRS
jgi:hypothetical protein